MPNLCSACGWTVAELALVDVEDDLLLVCVDCENEVAAV